MSPSLKAILALVFVVVVGAILIQPILDAADTDVVATPPSEPTEEPEEPKTWAVAGPTTSHSSASGTTRFERTKAL